METKAFKIRPVKRLFEHLTDSHKLLINPTEGIIETCRKHRKMGVVLSINEMQKLLDMPDLSISSEIRDKAMMEVLYSTAIRLNELISLDLHDVDFHDKVIYIRKGKGRKERVVPLGDNTVKYLTQYLKKVRTQYAKRGNRERAFFLNKLGKSLTPEGIRQLLRKYRIAANINKPVSPHTFRRSSATHLLQQGVDVRYIQKFLGHSNLKTTQYYTKVMPVEVKQTHNQSHPGKDL